MIRVYTDGSSLGNPGPAGRGVITVRDEKTHSYSGGTGKATNNQMELQAVIEALKKLGGTTTGIAGNEGVGLFTQTVADEQQVREQIDIFTDSEYVQKGVEEWLETWVERGRRVSGKNKTIQNVEQRQELYQLLQCFTDLNWHRVKAHNGDEYNEQADNLARKAAKSYQ